MENKIDEVKIIDFLYGELPEEERIEVEKFLDENPEERKRLQEFHSTRCVLKNVNDREMIPPAFVFDDREKTIPFFKSQAFRWVASIAAGLIILLVSAALTKFNVASTDQGLLIGFGDLKMNDPEVNKENVQAWMSEVMNNYENNTNERISGVENRLTAQLNDRDNAIRTNIQKILSKTNRETETLMRAYLAQINDGNKEILQNFFVATEKQQKEYMTRVLADFNSFYQNQRDLDLKVIETSMNLMKNSTDEKQLEQDQMLASLYNIVVAKSN